MSERDELLDLSETWLGIASRSDLRPSAALARRRRQRALFVGELLGAAIMLALAVGFWLAGDGPVHRVAAALFVATAVLTAAVAGRTRAALGRWADWTPAGVLAFRLRECELAIVYARWQLGACALLAAFAAFVWLAAALRWDVLRPGFHYIYAACVAVVVLAVCAWAARRIPAKRAERARLRKLLEELTEA